ncbi:uncharacterized protein LOC127289118 [Leptopilina boulardi]|uniref:uncharacterized protein LOC127289118 n=1 Tax=Leptopilina boulardi TaxID=63433 RepID=UPI0021F58D85|nr:uncharacterized protein LOC127289118 [Leptopilina boulardi]
MKTYFIVLMVVTIGYIQHVPAMSMVEPISSALMSVLAEDEIPTESMCPANYQQIEKLKIQAVRLQLKLSPLITGKLKDPHSPDGVDDLIVQYCKNDEDINKTVKSLSENVKNCQTEKGNIDNVKLEKLETDAITKICAGTGAMITWNIINLNIAEGRKPDGTM